MSGDQMLNSVGTEASPAHTREQKQSIVLALLFDPSRHNCDRWLRERRRSLFASFALTTDMGARAERHVLLAQAS